jgi:hypothetical protein
MLAFTQHGEESGRPVAEYVSTFSNQTRQILDEACRKMARTYESDAFDVKFCVRM